MATARARNVPDKHVRTLIQFEHAVLFACDFAPALWDDHRMQVHPQTLACDPCAASSGNTQTVQHGHVKHDHQWARIAFTPLESIIDTTFTQQVGQHDSWAVVKHARSPTSMIRDLYHSHDKFLTTSCQIILLRWCMLSPFQRQSSVQHWHNALMHMTYAYFQCLVFETHDAHCACWRSTVDPIGPGVDKMCVYRAHHFWEWDAANQSQKYHTVSYAVTFQTFSKLLDTKINQALAESVVQHMCNVSTTAMRCDVVVSSSCTPKLLESRSYSIVTLINVASEFVCCRKSPIVDVIWKHS